MMGQGFADAIASSVGCALLILVTITLAIGGIIGAVFF